MQIKYKIRKLASFRHKISRLLKNLILKIKDLRHKMYNSKLFMVLRKFGHKMRRFRAFAWSERKARKYKVQFGYMIVMMLVVAVTLFIFKIDLGKDYGYDKVESVSYEDIDWREKYDNDGFSYSRQGDFKYKIVITPPNKSFIFKPSTDIAEVKMFIKDLRGSIQIPKGVTVIDQEGRTSTSRTIWTMSNQEKMTLIGHAHYTSLLGLSFVSPYQATTIKVNGQFFNMATIQVPKDATIIKYGDQFGANSYKIDDQNIFFHSFTNAAVVYYQKNFHFTLQLLIILSLITATFLIIFYNKVDIKKIHFKNKHFIIFFVLIVGSMLLLSIMSPSPKKLALSWGTSATVSKTDDHTLYPQYWIQRYLRWVLYLNQAVDVVVLGDTGGDCANDLNFRMGRYGIKKFIILEEHRNSSCAQSIINEYPTKVSIVPQSEIKAEIENVKRKNYGYNKYTFKYTAGMIFLLSNMLLGLIGMFLIWKAMSIKKLRDMLFFIVYGFSSYYLTIIIYIVVGWIARMPIGYHGSNNQGLIMSNYFLPGTISGGNNLRNLFALLGIILILVTSHKIFKLLNMRVYFIVISILCLLMVIPSSEYHTKRFILSAMSAEAYIWDYKQDIVNSLDFYRSIREANFVDYYKRVTDPVTHGNKDLSHASSLKGEGKWEESQQELKDIIIEYKDEEQIQAKAHFLLASLYHDQAKSKSINNLAQGFVDNSSYYHLALEEYLLFISNYPNDGNLPEVMNKAAEIYTYFQQYDKAIKTYEAILKLFPNKNFNNWIRQKLADLYIKEGQNQEAIKIFKDIIDNNLTTDIQKAKFSLANTYIKTDNPSRAIATLDDILPDGIRNPRTLLQILSALNRIKDYAPADEYNLIKKAVDLEAWGSTRNAVVEYSNIENRIENKYYKSIVKYKIADLSKSISFDNLNNDEDSLNSINHIIEQKTNEIISANVSNALTKAATILSGRVTLEESRTSNLKVLINDDFEFEKIEDGSVSGLTVNSLSIIVDNLDTKCGNNICEIGESDYSCSADCLKNKPQIIVKASNESGQGNKKSELQLSINDEMMKQWQVSSALSSDLNYPINFIGNNKYVLKFTNSKGSSRILIEQISINNEVIYINRYLEASGTTILSTSSLTAITQAEVGPIQSRYDKFALFVDQSFSKISPINYDDFLRTKRVSRGMMLYFTSIIGLMFVTFYSRNFRTYAITLFMLFLARGILRVAEQDPFRAWISMDPGVKLAVELSLSLIVINAIIYVISKTIKYSIIYIKKVRK